MGPSWGVLVWNAYKEIGAKDVFCPLEAGRISRIEIILEVFWIKMVKDKILSKSH